MKLEYQENTYYEGSPLAGDSCRHHGPLFKIILLLSVGRLNTEEFCIRKNTLSIKINTGGTERYTFCSSIDRIRY